jgi:hypothetical protein
MSRTCPVCSRCACSLLLCGSHGTQIIRVVARRSRLGISAAVHILHGRNLERKVNSQHSLLVSHRAYCRPQNPHHPRTLRSMRSTSSSLSTATLPCLRIQAANLGSVFSSASAKSFWRHHALWNGQYAYREAFEHVHRASALQDEHACEGGWGDSDYSAQLRVPRDAPAGT